MGLRKNRAQVQVVSINNERIGVGESQRKSTSRDTHWDFLDEIEAPMWVDLIQESKLGYQDRDDGDDEWFNISHPFHQFSSLQSMSPKIPCSVLRSRGKDFRSRKWDMADENVGNLKDRPVSAVSVSDNLERELRCYRTPLGIGGSQSDDSCEKSCVTEIDVKHDQVINTSESSCEGQHQKLSDFSSRLPDDTIRFLSLLKSNMRKSYVTRQASRVLVTEGTQSGRQNSCSSKSSVGSSSTNGCDGNKEMTPGSRYVPGADLRKNPSTANPKMRTQSAAFSSVKQQNTLGKVQQQTAHAKVLVPFSSNKLSTTAATVKGRGKAMADSGRQTSAAAKENFPRNIISNTRMRPSGDVMQVQKVNGRKLPENSAKTKLASQKEKLGRGGEGKSGTVVHQRAYHPR